MTPEAKAKLSKTIRALRERLLADLDDALRADYSLGIELAEQARLPEARAQRRARLDAWVAEQVRALPDNDRKTKKQHDAAVARLRGEVVEQAASTWLNRLVYLRLLEGMKLRPAKLLTGGLESRVYADFRDLAQAVVGSEADESDGYMLLLGLVFDELALDLPGLFERSGLSELVPMRWPTLRHVVEALDDPELASCWTDDMTLGWVYQYWNDPEREAIDDKLNAGGKVAPDQIASKTQMFTERYMVDWLVQNSLGPMWLAICAKHGWTAKAVGDGTLARLEQRRIEWRAKRESGAVELTDLMPLHGDDERRWAYYVEQPMPADAPELAPESVRTIKMIDPAVGSGHFLVVAFELLVALYREEAEHRGEAWSDQAIVESILANNLHGIDLDPRAVQIAAAALMLKAQQVCPQARPRRINLVASKLRLGSLPADDAALVELRTQVASETGVPGQVVDALVRQLAGADHLGSLLKIGHVLDEVLKVDAEQGGLFGGFSQGSRREGVPLEQAKASLQRRLEEFLAAHTTSADLGLRLRGEQLAAGVRFVRMLEEGSYDLVIGNPPYQGTAKMESSEYVKKWYEAGKADLYAAFLMRGLELARNGGVSALLTMRNWMFIKQYAKLRMWLMETHDLRVLHDLASGAFEAISSAQVVVSVVASIFRRGPMSGQPAIVLKAFDDATVTTPGETQRKRAATSCQAGRHDFEPLLLDVVPDWPLLYSWSAQDILVYRDCALIGRSQKVTRGITTGNDARFVRACHELRTSDLPPPGPAPARFCRWQYYVKGAAGTEWIEPAAQALLWDRGLLELNVHGMYVAPATVRLRDPSFYHEIGVAFSPIGSVFSARRHRFPAIFGNMGGTVFGSQPAKVLCAMNSSRARHMLQSLNPGMHFEVGDVNRLPLFDIQGAELIFDTLEAAFTLHESHREPSVEFRRPGPSPWRHAQEWAQLAVDREENSPLPPYEESLDPPSPTDHLSFALGIALGRFDPTGAGILDPQTADPTRALPHGVLFLDGTLAPESPTDSLGHPASAALHTAWSEHSPKIDTKRKHLRDYLRLDVFDVHRSMYENRPIHWPVSSAKKTFVAWISIHRWHAGTLRYLLAEYLHPTKQRLDGELADLRKARDSANKQASRTAEKRLDQVTAWREELAEFIANVSACAEQGPPPPDPKTRARDDDAAYDPDLDDGVMVNSAALWPLLTPQWKDPKKWWKELATGEGRKDCDWSHLAARYFKARVDTKCRTDPSLAVAHGCFWKYHPERAHAWELRLQDEIGPDFTIDEADSDPARARFLADHPQAAQTILSKELARRTRKLEKAGADSQADIEDEADEA